MFKKLKKGRDKEGEWGKYDDRVMQAVEDGDIERLQAALAKKGTSPIKMDPEGRVPLHLAAELGQFGCLDLMIQLGTTVAAADSQGYTVLHYASMGGHTDCVQRLLLANAPLNARELTGKTALHLAVLGGHVNCCKILLKAKATVDITEERGKTALMIAAQLGHLAICRDLIDQGANVNLQDYQHRTALMMACEANHSEIVELLIKRGARTDFTDTQGYDASYYAKQSGGDKLRECLQSAPSVATWDVKAHDETDGDARADSVDSVDHFDAERCESPVPNSLHQQNGNLKRHTENKTTAKPAQHSKEMKEMEEENEVLYDELSHLTLDHKKAQEKIKALEQRLQQASMGHGDNLRNQEFEEEFENVKRILQMEKDKRTKAEAETEALKARMTSLGGDFTEDELDSNWGDSDDDLFDLPDNNGSGGKVKSPRRMDTANRLSSENTGVVAILRSQIVSLRLENEELKRKSVASTSSGLDNSRVSELEADVSSLGDELDALKGRGMINDEIGELQKNNGVLMEEIANISQRLALATDENERLKKMTQNGQKASTLSQSANSALQSQYEDLLHDKQALDENIARHSQDLALRNAECEKLKGRITELTDQNKQLQNTLEEKTQNGHGATAEELTTLASENARLESLVAKQSKAISQQNERARRDKQKYAELLAERDHLKQASQGQINRVLEGINREKYDELVDENNRLRQSLESHEGEIDCNLDKDRLDRLTKENWRLQDEIRKQDDEMIQLRQDFHKLQQNGDSQELQSENQRLKEKIETLESEDSWKAEEAKRFAELLAENETLTRTIQDQAEAFESQLPASVGFSKKRYTELLMENRKLKTRSQQETLDMTRVKDLKEVVRLQQKLQEAEEKHKQSVTVYRTHLLNAIQDDLNPKVRDSLIKIAKIHRGEKFV